MPSPVVVERLHLATGGNRCTDTQSNTRPNVEKPAEEGGGRMVVVRAVKDNIRKSQNQLSWAAGGSETAPTTREPA